MQSHEDDSTSGALVSPVTAPDYLNIILPELPPGLLGVLVLALCLVASLVSLAGSGILGRLCLRGGLAGQGLGL